MKSSTFALALVAFFVVVMTGTFLHNLPTWCENPERPGNWILAPLCK